MPDNSYPKTSPKPSNEVAPCPESVSGPMTAAEVVTPSADKGNPLGAGSLKALGSPFKLGG